MPGGTMKTIGRLVFAAAPAIVTCSILLAGSPARAEDGSAPDHTALNPDGPLPTKLTASFDASYASKYLFQGFDYSDGRSVIQPELVAGMGPLSATVWTNLQPNLNEFNEIDVSVKYTATWRMLSIAPGYLNLTYPNRDWSPSQEFTLDLSATSPLSPTLSLHYDFEAGTGLYATLGVTQPVRNRLSLGVNLFYQSGYYDMTGFPAMEIKAAVPFTAAGVAITPALSRFVTWENDRFKGEAALPSTWLFTLNVARPLVK